MLFLFTDSNLLNKGQIQYCRSSTHILPLEGDIHQQIHMSAFERHLVLFWMYGIEI